MIRSDYRYAIEFYTSDRVHLGMVPFDPDFEPAVESAVLAGLRCGALLPDAEITAALLQPSWAARGAPVVDAFEICLESDGAAPFVHSVPRDWLRSAAHTASATMVDRKLLAAGDLFRYEIRAFHTASASAAATATARSDLAAPGDGAIGATLRTPALAAGRYALGEALRDAQALDDPDTLDPVLLIPARVIEQACEAARRAGDSETGGILVGKVHRSEDPGDIVIEVTAQVPAAHGVSTETRFTFTPETWAAASGAIALRRRGEAMVGWWHSHGWFCRNCSKQAQQSCTYSQPFFSGEDVHLHRTVFGRATNVALLVSDFGPRGQEVAVFGWRAGAVVRRGYYATGQQAARVAESAAAKTRESQESRASQAAQHDAVHERSQDGERAQQQQPRGRSARDSRDNHDDKSGEPTHVCTQNP